MSTPLTTSDTRLVVAGGGGGGASCGNAGGAAGDSSVTGAGTGGNGSSTVDCKGGTAGGNGGFGGTAGGGAGTGQCGSGAGSLGQGEPQNTGCDPGYVGGAGGGGYYGGGAGADASGYAGGGGGAGSSFWVSGASHTSMGMNTTSLAPEVVITPLASEDSWKAGANKAWSASSPKTKFVSTAATITCTTNTASGPSVGSGPDIGALTMNAPKFSNCKDSLGDRATVTTKSSGWTVSFISDIGNAKCPAGSGKDETAGADCVVVGVPKDAATIVLGGVKACTIKVQPNGPTKVGAKATDPGGTTKDKIIVSSQRLSYKGCGVLSGKAKFSGTYTLKSPNSGVLVDKS